MTTGRLAHEQAVMAEQVTARGVRGVVAAAAPLAAQAGVAALRQGGNAFDAAVAAAIVETVVLPRGFGGDLVAIGRADRV
jgi:gamma-glutamyltranspeptidase/glutathione hydrolase